MGSGVYAGEYYIDTDPGQGNGTPMTSTASGTITATHMLTLPLGAHQLCIRAIDEAGNWGNVVKAWFVYL